MNNIDIGVLIAVVTLVVVLFKYNAAQNEKRSSERHTGHDNKFKEQGRDINFLKKEVDKTKKIVQTTREEMIKNYVTKDDIDKLTEGIKEDFGEVFRKIDSLATPLNQLIGQVKQENVRKQLPTKQRPPRQT